MDIPADGSVEAFRETYEAIDRVYDLYARSCDVTPTEFWCLAAVAEGVTSQAQIADRLGASRQTVNSAFKQLQASGLVTLEPDPSNGRVKRAVLTEEGRVFADGCLAHLGDVEERVWNSLDPADRAVANRLMGEFLHGLASALLPVDSPALSEKTVSLTRKEPS